MKSGFAHTGPPRSVYNRGAQMTHQARKTRAGPNARTRGRSRRSALGMRARDTIARVCRTRRDVLGGEASSAWAVLSDDVSPECGFSTKNTLRCGHRGETSSLSTAHAEAASPPRSSSRVRHTRAIVSRARIPSADRRDRPPARAFGPARVCR
jgi:hypothetical protein